MMATEHNNTDPRGTHMKQYEGYIGESTERLGPWVQVKEEDGSASMLTHHVRHSPDGHSWGYAGSGPAELAKDILWDHLGTEPHPACYQAFKTAHVATWPQDQGWTLSAEAIDAWLEMWSATEAAGGGQGFATIAAYNAWTEGASPSEAAAIDHQAPGEPLTAAQLAARVAVIHRDHPDAKVFAYLGPEGLLLQAEPVGAEVIPILRAPLTISAGAPTQ